MCTSFTCSSCHRVLSDRCANAPTEHSYALCHQQTYQKPKDCNDCVRINGVISNLNSLVYQAPFLESQGLSGIEHLADWEKEGYRELLSKNVDGALKAWDAGIESREERHDAAKRIRDCGLGSVEDAREEITGENWNLTPPENFGTNTNILEDLGGFQAIDEDIYNIVTTTDAVEEGYNSNKENENPGEIIKRKSADSGKIVW